MRVTTKVLGAAASAVVLLAACSGSGIGSDLRGSTAGTDPSTSGTASGGGATNEPSSPAAPAPAPAPAAPAPATPAAGPDAGASAGADGGDGGWFGDGSSWGPNAPAGTGAPAGVVWPTWTFIGQLAFAGTPAGFTIPLSGQLATDVLVEANVACAPALTQASVAIGTPPTTLSVPLDFIAQRQVGALLQALLQIDSATALSLTSVSLAFSSTSGAACPINVYTVLQE